MRLISIHPLVKVCVTREEVSNSVLVTQDMGKGIGEILQKGDPMGLMTSDLLGFAEVLEVFMIHANFNSVLHAKEEWASTFEPKDNRSQFLIMDIIVLLSRLETVTVEANRVNAVSKFLGDDSSKGPPRGIGFKDELLGPVRGMKDGGGGADVF